MADTKTWQMFIGGTWADSSTGETEPDINPATGERIRTFPALTEREIEDKLDGILSQHPEFSLKLLSLISHY